MNPKEWPALREAAASTRLDGETIDVAPVTSARQRVHPAGGTP